MPQSQLAQPSLSSASELTYFFSKKLILVCYFSPVLCVLLVISRIAMSMIQMMSSLLASTILSHCTLKFHRTLKPLFSTTCSRVCLYHCSAHSSLVFPHSCQRHILLQTVMSPLLLTNGLTWCIHVLGDLHFLLSLRTS